MYTFSMLTKQDKNYIADAINNALDKKFDDFATIIQSSFKNVYEKFDAVDNRFDAVDARFESIDERFDKLDYRLDVLEYKIVGGQERRLDKIEDDVRTIKTSLNLQ
jgi:hypothetical protein